MLARYFYPLKFQFFILRAVYNTTGLELVSAEIDSLHVLIPFTYVLTFSVSLNHYVNEVNELKSTDWEGNGN